MICGVTKPVINIKYEYTITIDFKIVLQSNTSWKIPPKCFRVFENIGRSVASPNSWTFNAIEESKYLFCLYSFLSSTHMISIENETDNIPLNNQEKDS